MKLQAHIRLRGGQKSFLPTRLIMLDCEMSGLDPKVDDLLQVAALKLELQGDRYVALDEFNEFLRSDAQPTSDFAREHMTEVYRQANESPLSAEDLRLQFQMWLEDGGWLGDVSPCGDCVPTDVLFLYEKGVISLSHFEGDTPVPGTFHFEYFDMNSIKMVARHKA